MSEKNEKQGAVVKDTVIYMVAKGVEAVVGILTMSAMTYLFASEQMGQYSTINIAITTLGLVLVQWLAQAVLRYVNKYEVDGRQEEFFATVFSAWLKINLIVIAVGALVIIFLRKGLNVLELKTLYWLKDSVGVLIVGILWFITYNTSQLVISVVAAMRKSKLNLMLSVISVVGKLMCIVLFCFVWGSKIEWIFLSYFLVDGLVSLIGIVRLKLYRYIKSNKKSREILVELKKYGTPLMGNMVTTSVLNKSDIYIVTFFLGSSAAGIYQTNYSLVATAFTMLSSAIMRGHYPTILRVWSEGRKKEANQLVSAAVRFYLLLAIPAVVGVGMISDVIAKVLYAPEYFSGNSIMVWVAMAMMILGLTEYNIKPWEMNAKTNEIFLRSLIGGIINVILNLVFVSMFGYKTAAVTTFVGFLVYFILSRIGTRKYEQWTLPLRTFIRISLSSLGMALVLYVLKKIMPFNIITLVVMVCAGAMIYGGLLVLTGEMRNEFEDILKGLKRKLKG
ncbi:lipopolysaccharide biosynthesis protein [Faecalimonas sp.]